MYICVCKGITEKQLTQTIEEGAHSIDQLESRCHAGTDCGSCRFRLHQVLKEALQKTDLKKLKAV